MKKLFQLLFFTGILVFNFLNVNGQGAKPVYEDVKGQLPVPVLEKDSCWLEMYNYCWKEAFGKIKSPMPGSGFVSDYIDEGFNPNIFLWDTQFMLLFWKYAYTIFPAIQSNDNFYKKQHADGYICREIREADGKDVMFMGKQNTVNPPLFALAELEYVLMSGDTSRLSRVLPVLAKQAAWIAKHRVCRHSAHQLFWQKRFGSGMDNCPRKGNGWVDMSAQMALFYNNLASLYLLAGNAGEAAGYYKRGVELISRINHWMWDEKTGMYCDVKNNGTRVNNTTIAAFWTLLAGVSSEEQGKKLTSHLRDSAEFWRLIPFPSLPANHKKYVSNGGDYWKGGVWAPTDYIVIKGLEKYGYNDLAYKATEKLLNGMYKVFKQTGTVWENYSPDFYERGNRSMSRFVGWTGVVPITMLIEDVIGIQANAFSNTLTWHIQRGDRHGVKNLHFGKNAVSLVFEPNVSGNPVINVDCVDNFTLKIYWNNTVQDIIAKPGKSIYQL